MNRNSVRIKKLDEKTVKFEKMHEKLSESKKIRYSWEVEKKNVSNKK